MNRVIDVNIVRSIYKLNKLNFRGYSNMNTFTAAFFIDKRNFLIVSLMVLVLLSSCTNEVVAPASCYPEEVGQIISQNCAVSGCHVGSNAPENLNLQTWNDLLKGSNFGAVVIPFEPDWSHVFQHANQFPELGTQATPIMPPPPATRLSFDQVRTLREWIVEGAPNCNGEIPWEEQLARTTGKVFALCAGSDLVAVSDIQTNLITRFIEVGQIKGSSEEAPHFISLSPNGEFFLVSLLRGSIVEKYRTDNYEFEGRVEVDAQPALIAIHPDGERAVITHWNDDVGTPRLTLLNVNTMEIISQERGDNDFIAQPHGIAATADFSTIYVTANSGNYYAKITLDENGFTGLDKILLGPDVDGSVPRPSTQLKPYQCVLSSDESLLFITCNETDEVRVFDTATDELVAQIPTGEFPRLMTYDAQDERLYVACANEDNFTEQGSMRGCVTVIDTENLEFIQNIYRLGHRPHGLDIDPTRRLLFVSSENIGGADPPHHVVEGASGPPGKYNVVDLTTLEVLEEEETEIGVFPNALIVSP